ncbi:MAG: hypothetical protein QM278_00835 [Pseudomonadota bacterium]|nr:hypothetical protein [Pseudomonadota bacterium]
MIDIVHHKTSSTFKGEVLKIILVLWGRLEARILPPAWREARDAALPCLSPRPRLVVQGVRECDVTTI